MNERNPPHDSESAVSPAAAPHALRSGARRGRPWVWVVLALLLLAGAGGGWWWHARTASRSGAPGEGGTPGAAGSRNGATAGAPSAAGRAAGGQGRFAGGQVQPVTVGVVRRQDIRVLLAAIGTISARNTAVVRAKVDGELRALRFREGETVKAGQLLAEIDPRPFQTQLAQVQGNLARDQAQLRNAQIDLQRYRDLLAQDSIAKQLVDTQEALVRQNQGTVQANQALVDAAKLNLSYTRVTAPIAGRLGLKQADLGNVVHPGDATGIVTITQTQPIDAVFSVPEASLPQISRRLQTGDALPVEAWDRERKNKLATGSVRLLDNAIDTATGTIRMKAQFANANGTLFPNQFANIVLQVDTLRDVIAVPSAAVQRGTQGTYVYAVQDDGAVALRKVTLGVTEGDWVSVQGDVQAGDRVVTDGADRLRDGARVQVIDPAGAQNAAAAAARARSAGARRGLENLSPEVREKLRAMAPEERRAYLQKLREQQGGGGGAGAPGPGGGTGAGTGAAPAGAAAASAAAGSPGSAGAAGTSAGAAAGAR